MIVYFSSDYTTTKVYSDLQSKRKKTDAPNFLACPAVRDSWKNVFMFSPNITSEVSYDLTFISRTNGLPISKFREPHLINTNIFNLDSSSYFFSETPLTIKVTAPYFHNTQYQKQATFIGGNFDIGRWFRPVESEIITWGEEGKVLFMAGEPLFYVEFLTDETVELKKFQMNPLIGSFTTNLVFSPFQVQQNLQGSLESRYQAFDNSDYRRGLLEEIKAAVVDKVD